MENYFYLGVVELREEVHGHKAVIHMKHGCILHI